MRTREAIANFLDKRVEDSPFLIPLWSPSLETQVMTSRQGVVDEDEPNLFTDPETHEHWKDFRWPWQAGTDPKYSDPQITFSPAARVDRVGTTWWDFESRKSIAACIDIDFQGEKAATTNTNDSETLHDVVERLKTLDYVTIVRSTGGKGLHVYVFFDNCPDAQNHHEHTIVARKTLRLIGQDLDYPIENHVDCVGAVLWIWAKSSPADHPGFSVVKEGGKLDATRLASIELPQPSVRGRSEADFEVVELEEEHKRILEAIQAEPFYFNIRHDMNLIHTHTCAIKQAIDHGLEVRGDFVTSSDGSDPNTANCFMAPQRGGSFRVVRFGQSQHEPDWEFVNEKNFCYLNEDISYQERVSNLAKSVRAGKYQFNAESIAELCESVGEPLDSPIPDSVDDVWAVLIDGGFQIRFKGSLEETPEGWSKTGKNEYVKTVRPKQTGNFKLRMLRRADERVRFVVQDGSPRGWFHRSETGWLEHRSYGELSCVVQSLFGEFERSCHTTMMENPWHLVTKPFQPEYPGGRQWNRNAPQLAVEPAESGGNHPHFDMILEHIGGDLNTAVQQNEWCRKAAINTGADYLRAWLACLIHHTDQPLPYLFLVGPQNSGKSIFHEMMKFLFTHGITSANSALTSSFNGELAGCFLVYVEERDLGDKRHDAYSKIKEWVTGRDLLVQEKYQTPYTTPNYLHFVQMANSSSHLPLEDGDTRIVASDVPALSNPIPKAIMEKALREEAPRFLRTLLNTVIPPPVDRLRIPALKTVTKELMERRFRSPLMQFAMDNVFQCNGHKVELEEFYNAFKSFCNTLNETAPPMFTVQQELMLRSDRFTMGMKGQKVYLLNVSLNDEDRPKSKPLVPNSRGTF